jgi:hypothetical protein
MFKFNKLSTLNELFDKYITISAIAEDFIAFDAGEDVSECLAYTEKHHFDVIGVKENGHIIGYARLSKRDKGLLGEHKREFQEDEVVRSSVPLPQAVHRLSRKQCVFVKEGTGEIVGIITRADLYKPVFRMCLYGLISVLEIHMFELIRRVYSGNTWQDSLTETRQKNVAKIYDERRQRNEEIDLLYCTEFCDKRTIIEKSDVALKATRFKSKVTFSKCLKDIEGLRNEIAHSCKVSKGRWEDVSVLCKKAESMIDKIEQFLTSRHSN